MPICISYNEYMDTEAYSEPCQTSEIECFAKIDVALTTY